MSQPPAKKPQIFVKPLPNLPGICITICPIVNDILHSSLFFSYYLFSFHLCLINNLDHGWNPKKPATSVSTHDPIIFYELFLLLFALRDTKENRLVRFFASNLLITLSLILCSTMFLFTHMFYEERRIILSVSTFCS